MRSLSQGLETGWGEREGEGAVVPLDARERSIWVQGRLRLHATSFAAIARALGVSPRAIGQAMYAPNHRAEIAIASAVGLEPRQLFAERYGRDGARLHSIRTPDRSADRTAGRGAGRAAGPDRGDGDLS